MILQLTLEGGLYGRLELSALDTGSLDAGLDPDLAAAVQPDALQAAEKDGKGSPSAEQTEHETYFLNVTDIRHGGGRVTYRLSREAVDMRPNLRRLLDFLWDRTRPETASAAS